MQMIDEILEMLKSGMEETIEALRREMSKRRTGRANVALLDGIRIDYYGTRSPLNQVASVKVADPRLIIIKPWEKSMVVTIEKAILQSSLGLTPSTDGELIRLPIPPLTEERRKDLVKEIKRLGEEAKVGLRSHRRDANEMLKDSEKEGTISEDDMHRGMTSVQEATDEYSAKVDELVQAKEKEILEF